MIKKSLLGAMLVTAAGALAACQSSPGDTPPIGQFYAGDDGTDTVGLFEQGFDQAVDDPAETIFIIYNHGTYWGAGYEDCYPGTMPSFVRRWGEYGIDGRDVTVFYLCTQVTEKRFVLGRQRSEENEALLDRLAVLGVPRQHIFVFGHSGGASAALLTAERAQEKFNAAVVSAPGYGFAYLEAEGESANWLDLEYDKWRSRLATADDMQALVYVYEGDIITPPAQALFLRDHPGVRMIQIQAPNDDGVLCKDEPEPHFYWWSACFKRDQVDVVEAYIIERLDVDS